MKRVAALLCGLALAIPATASANTWTGTATNGTANITLYAQTGFAFSSLTISSDVVLDYSQTTKSCNRWTHVCHYSPLPAFSTSGWCWITSYCSGSLPLVSLTNAGSSFPLTGAGNMAAGYAVGITIRYVSPTDGAAHHIVASSGGVVLLDVAVP